MPGGVGAWFACVLLLVAIGSGVGAAGSVDHTSHTHGGNKRHWAYTGRHLENHVENSIRRGTNLHAQIDHLLEEQDKKACEFQPCTHPSCLSLLLSERPFAPAATPAPDCSGVDCSGHGQCYPVTRPGGSTPHWCKCDGGFRGDRAVYTAARFAALSPIHVAACARSVH